jgi:signal transduction histidine kinase/ActR/RegA family two-component response regulator
VRAISAHGKHKWGISNLQSSSAQHTGNVGRRAPAVRAISARLAKGLSDLQRKTGFSRLSISRRLILLLLALALPLNLVIVGVTWDLVSRANEVQRTSLMFAARSIAAGVDSELGRYVALAEALSRSPALLNNDLLAFEAEARRAFPAGGHTLVVLSDADGLQLINTFYEPGRALPRRRPPEAIAAMHRALSTRSIVITDLVKSPVSPRWFATVQVPIFKDGAPFRGLGIIFTQEAFLHLLRSQAIPKNWRAGIIDGQGRYIASVPHAEVGEFASQGSRAAKEQAGLSAFLSRGGDPLIQANAHPSIGAWTVGVAVKTAELRQAAWMTVRWAVVLGIGLSAGSLLLAWGLARQITQPIHQLRNAFSDVSAESGKPIEVGPPEILELQDTLYRKTSELMEALSKLEREMSLREEAQAALAQSQRMEAMGQIAGGVAHDFNNVLAAISTYLDVAMPRSADEKGRKAIQGALDSIEMGASLTRRLLILSRRQGVGLERLDLNDRPTATIELLRRTLGDQVTVTLSCSREPCQTFANPGDVDNAILNLAINARDAMPDGGVLTIETRVVTLDAETAGRLPNARPGDYVMLTASDTGHGMSPEVLERAMEPFFSTKEAGKNTGLGLATVHGTVRQSGGFVAIESAVGQGTSVHLYFPKAEPVPIVSRANLSIKEAPLGDGELILVVEDNDKVREATVSGLESLGYAVLEAKTGPDAITLIETDEPIALVLSDIVMPGGMTGYDVAERICSMKPDLKVLLTSGYSDLGVKVKKTARDVRILAKPYTRAQLARALRETLDGTIRQAELLVH